ncbi:hypothetical protein OPQ81_000354 [Rhizoctonia solani]|nr:hypothetical protein OPQ81_000354 [Rhizoctonia solani]
MTFRGYLPFLGSKLYGRRTTPLPPLLHQLFLTLSHLPSSPSNPYAAYLNGPEFEAYIASHFNRMAEFAYFKPMKDQSDQLRDLVISRVRNSHFSRWLMLLCARICESIVEGDRSQNELHLRWIGDIEAAIRRRLSRDPTPREEEALRGDWLEVSLVSTALGHSSNAYLVLHNATPTFLQSVYSLPDLWEGSSNPVLLPLLNIIGSKHHALSAFTLMDCTCAMVFGLPQQVEYDTSAGSLSKEFLPHEWAHSAPTEFQILLVQINACRDKSAGARDWREIEHVLVHWQAHAAQHDESWESWMMVAWLAVQESWRLALLAYLYLAVCECSSDDERIQRCVTQILQVVGTVKKHEDSDVNVPFFIQYLMAGICAQSEKQRRTVRNKLSDTKETKFWMMPGADFVPVLNHLWHGAGSGGRPITWADYIYSRKTLLPVPM